MGLGLSICDGISKLWWAHSRENGVDGARMTIELPLAYGHAHSEMVGPLSAGQLMIEATIAAGDERCPYPSIYRAVLGYRARLRSQVLVAQASGWCCLQASTPNPASSVECLGICV